MKKEIQNAARDLCVLCVKNHAWIGVSSVVETSSGSLTITAKLTLNNLGGGGSHFARVTYNLNGVRITAKKVSEIV